MLCSVGNKTIFEVWNMDIGLEPSSGMGIHGMLTEADTQKQSGFKFPLCNFFPEV